MPKNSRRLPGGKVRRPPARAERPAPGVAVSADDQADHVADSVEQVEADVRRGVLPGERGGAPPRMAAPRRAGPAQVRAIAAGAGIRPAGSGGTRPGAAGAGAGSSRAGAAGASGVPVSRQAQAAAVLRQRSPQGAPRAGRSLMDLAASNYSHIQRDLARIGILAAVMLVVIVALSFVLK